MPLVCRGESWWRMLRLSEEKRSKCVLPSNVSVYWGQSWGWSVWGRGVKKWPVSPNLSGHLARSSAKARTEQARPMYLWFVYHFIIQKKSAWKKLLEICSLKKKEERKSNNIEMYKEENKILGAPCPSYPLLMFKWPSLWTSWCEHIQIEMKHSWRALY